MIRMTIGTSSTMKSAGMIRKSDREEHLDRRLLRALLGVGAAALAELDREVPHDLAGRDAHRLALGDRAREHPHAGRVDAAEEVLERLDEREAHVLLLQRQAHLAGERLLDLRRGEPQRLREAEACLERHDDEVDQVGQVLLDLVAALAALRVDEHRRDEPAEDRRRWPRRGRTSREPRELREHSQTSGSRTAVRNCMPSSRSGVVVVHARPR